MATRSLTEMLQAGTLSRDAMLAEVDFSPTWTTGVLPQPRQHFLMTRCAACMCTRKDHFRDGACERCSCPAMCLLSSPPSPAVWADARQEMIALLAGLNATTIAQADVDR